MGIFNFKRDRENSQNKGNPESKVTPKLAEEKEISEKQEKPTVEAVVNTNITQKVEEKQTPKIEEKKIARSSVYGPVASWRLGRSLGIDMLCTEQRTCNFDCVYCQFPSPGKAQLEREEFVSLSKLFDDLNTAKGVAADWVTFSGMGEPTLAANLGDAISMAKSILGLPVAVLTNGSFIEHMDVRKALSLADMVVVKLDAADDNMFNAVNRPSGVVSLGKMLQQWQLFRMEYKGKLSINIMLSDLNKGTIHDLQLKARLILPAQIQLNTPLRSCGVKPLAKAELDKCKQWFWNFKDVINVYEAKIPVANPLNAEETEARHPTKVSCP